MPSIIEMPELVLEKIIEFSDFKSVLALREVCRDFRNFIENLSDTKLPDSKFEAITLCTFNKHRRKSDMFLTYEEEYGFRRQFYSVMEKSRSINGKTTILENSNIVDVAVQDLETVLKFQKSDLECLSFHFGDFQHHNNSLIHTLPDKLTTMLGKLNRRIKTKEFSLKVNHQSQIVPILRNADPDTLERLSLYSTGDMEIEIDDIVGTEQWKHAESIHCEPYLTNLKMEDVCHFSRISLKTNSVTARDMDTLKKTFLSSSELMRYEFESRNFNEQELSNIWGPAFGFESASHWYFQMKEWQVLDFVVRRELMGRDRRCYCLNFDIIDMEDVPDGAVIHAYNEN
ncbi:hypothetical protein B9Z55_021200 [Caenorhabditis nigoni]|uniref:F-box domain-containing protein n=1 Tax=Caenorhabditis nigoni TaxID=1611254 RepID=A0A2G5TQX3_9PELO|nr:hypothetical protein B9Z55_021200 [Caenorhabditis nigoni]